jgi:hypothetical protein
MIATTRRGPGPQTVSVSFRALVGSVLTIRLGRRVDRLTPPQKSFQLGGDFKGVPGWAIRTVVGTTRQLGTFVDHTEQCRQADNAAHAVTILQRRGHPVGRAFAVLEFSDFLSLLAASVPAEGLETTAYDPEVSPAAQDAS